MLKKLSSLTQVALLVLTVVYIPGYTASGRESSLPSCDNARQNYDAGKLYEALGVDSKASAKEIRRFAIHAKEKILKFISVSIWFKQLLLVSQSI